MIYFRRIPRINLGEWIDSGSEDGLQKASTLDDVLTTFADKTDLILLWDSDSQTESRVSTIVTSDGGVTDFLAWSTSYLPHLRPITSRFRVIEGATLKAAKTERWAPSIDVAFRNASIGLMLGELFSSDLGNGRTRRELVPTVNMFSGLSFVCLRELALKTGTKIDFLTRRWSSLRSMTKQRERLLKADSIASAIRVTGSVLGRMRVADLSPRERAMAEVCVASRTKPGLRPEMSSVPELAAVSVADGDTREVRYQKVQAALQKIANRGEGDRELDAFAVGFLANEINPGAMTFVDLVSTNLDRWPSALLWYGLCAGLSTRSNVTNEASGVGARAWREVVRSDSLLSAPIADLAFEELEVFLSSDRPTEDYPLFSHAFACVELAPTLWSSMSWVGRRSGESNEPAALSVRDPWRSDVERELGQMLARAQELLGQLSKGRPAPRQTSLELEGQGRRGKYKR